MAACIDPTTWNAAKAICDTSGAQSVHGLGVWGKRRRMAVAGLGILGDTNPLNNLNVQTMSVDQACGIAAQPICKPPQLTSYCKTYPNDKTCLPGGKSFCLQYPKDPSCAVKTDSLIPTTTASTTSTAGFSKLGLLALLAVGGFVVYKVATHKKSS